MWWESAGIELVPSMALTALSLLLRKAKSACREVTFEVAESKASSTRRWVLVTRYRAYRLVAEQVSASRCGREYQEVEEQLHWQIEHSTESYARLLDGRLGCWPPLSRVYSQSVERTLREAWHLAWAVAICSLHVRDLMSATLLRNSACTVSDTAGIFTRIRRRRGATNTSGKIVPLGIFHLRQYR